MDELVVAEWISSRAFGVLDRNQGPLKADYIESALSALRSVHIDLRLTVHVFESPYLRRVLAGIRHMQGKTTKKKAEPLSIYQLTSSIPKFLELYEVPGNENEINDTALALSAQAIEDLNTDTAMKLAFAGFLRTKALTYQKADLGNMARSLSIPSFSAGT